MLPPLKEPTFLGLDDLLVAATAYSSVASPSSSGADGTSISSSRVAGEAPHHPLRDEPRDPREQRPLVPQ